MTLSELHKARKLAPYLVFGISLLPWFVLRPMDAADGELPLKYIAPAIAAGFAGAYVMLHLRDSRWKREKDTYVGQQIRTRVMNMIPTELEVSDAEKAELAASEVYATLTGIFWETVERNAVLKSHKEHFYANGIKYSTSIDVLLICGFAGFCYSLVGVILWDARQAYAAALFIVLALASKFFAIPRARQEHLSLSREQLDLLIREEREFVEKRFCEVILGWRRARIFH